MPAIANRLTRKAGFLIFSTMSIVEPMEPPVQLPERESHTHYRVWLIEKLIINFALPSDLVFHTWRAFREHDTSQTTIERIKAMWSGKVSKYQKLLRVKDENGGVIPPDYQELCRQTPCGKARLFLASIAHRKPKRRRGQKARFDGAENLTQN